MRITLPPPGRAAAMALALVAVGGCTNMAVTSLAHPAVRHSPAGRSCSAAQLERGRPGLATITLTDTSPAPTVTVPPGVPLVVTVPGWDWGKATDVHAIRGGILRERCTVLLPGRGRRTIFVSTRPGRTGLSATVEPASNAMMPGWGGYVIVRAPKS